MVLDKIVKVKVSNNTVKHYQEKGYNCKPNDVIYVKIEDVCKGSTTKIHCRCDYCLEEFDRSACSVLIKEKHTCGKKECKQKLREETCVKLFGEKNAAFVKEKMEKSAKKFKENYGIGSENHKDYVDKRNKTNMKRVGNNRGYIDSGQHSKTMKTLCGLWKTAKCKIGSHKIASKHQIYLCELYDGILNMPIGHNYYGDIVLDKDMIVIEYNGLGHFMHRPLKDDEIINEQDNERDKDMVNMGYKIIRIQCKDDRLPDDNVMIKFLELCKKLFANGEKRIIIDTVNEEIYLGIDELKKYNGR